MMVYIIEKEIECLINCINKCKTSPSNVLYKAATFWKTKKSQVVHSVEEEWKGSQSLSTSSQMRAQQWDQWLCLTWCWMAIASALEWGPVRAQVPPAGRTWSRFSLSDLSKHLHTWRDSLGQALAEPLRWQLYQAPISQHFLASTIESGFSVCRWDGSPDGTVSGWPFLQSLLHNLSLYLLLWVYCSPF